MKKTGLFFILIITLCSVIWGQSAQTDKFDLEYFGLKPPGLVPEIFSPGFISSDEFEFSGTFTTDGKEYYFTRRPTLEGAANRLFYTKYVDGKWTLPAMAPFAKNIMEYEPNTSPDGERLFIQSQRSAPGEADAWILTNTDGKWSEPEYINEPLASGFVMYITETHDRTIYFTGGFDRTYGIFKAKFKNGKYENPEPVPSKEKIFRGAHPYIDPEEKYMIFDMQPAGPGRPELFISFNLGDDNWSDPINMGPEINKTKTEFAASVSHDGKYLFFHRVENRNGDIYWVDAQIIEKIHSKYLEGK